MTTISADTLPEALSVAARARASEHGLAAGVRTRARASEHGLAAGVRTRDVSDAHRLAVMLHAGMVHIGTRGVVDPSAPSGGFKVSGIGREHGHDGLDARLETKAVWTAL
ncbi:MAG TPA: aldehyde dehydrogenase family protein [Solirubrobacteraceae bacterium]|nr:aldehyde dehydrogenase family protein [Solirubrobacteraceae bacterium]